MDKIVIHEVGLRDGLQVEKTAVPLEEKKHWIEGLFASGIDIIQLGSFVNPTKVPQMADTDTLFNYFLCIEHGAEVGKKPPNVTLSGLVLNERGLERGMTCGVEMFCMGVSASETHSKKNTGMTTKEALERIIPMARTALDAGKRVQVSVQSAFGCGFEGPIPEGMSAVSSLKHEYYAAKHKKMTGMVMKDAEKCACKKPKEVLTDHNYSYVNGIPEAYGGHTDHVIGNPFAHKETGESTSEIERFHGTIKDRTKVFRAFRDVETLIQFTDGWLVYYNYFRTHESLDGKTPAEEANVKYDVKNWADLARVPVSKDAEIQSHKKPKIKLTIEKVKLDKAFKRKRDPQPRAYETIVNSDGTVNKRYMGLHRVKRVPQHFSDCGGGLTRRGDI